MDWIKTKKVIKVILFNMLLIVVLLALYESYLFFLVHHPSLLKKCPMGIRNGIGYLYNTGDRYVIQFSPACARFDDQLGYTLKPGQCTFSGREFSTRYLINSLGTRDDEKSLDHPRIIVAGDSFAMGWGVDQEETFAQQVERKTGFKVLNAAVASYGTAREMMILRRVPTDRLQYLIIQYCENDYDENKAFYLNRNGLPTMSEAEYRRYVEIDNQPKAYFFGKYLKLEIKKRMDEFKRDRTTENKPFDKDDVDLFIHAIIHSQLDLKNVQIIAFAMNGRNPDDNKAFPATLKKRIATGNYPPYIRNMIVLDFSSILKDDHFYVLDDHLNRIGHEVIADVLLKNIRMQ